MRGTYLLLVFLLFISGRTAFAQMESDLFAVDNSPTVSVWRLRHKIPGKAQAAFSRALQLARASQWQKGAEELKKALAIDPEFSDAHSNLGAHYIALNRFADATAELHQAIALDPGVSAYHSNMALAYLLLHRIREARMEAEMAVQLDGRNVTARYLLALLVSKSQAR